MRANTVVVPAAVMMAAETRRVGNGRKIFDIGMMANLPAGQKLAGRGPPPRRHLPG
jgi:hypothetical protein